MGRFLNADNYPSTGQGLLGNNMFAYCNNNPVIYRDSTGTVAETVFDVASLIVSAVEVANNSTDLGAWVGLMGDIVDLVPFVTGVGETIRTLRTASKVAEGTGAAIDTYRNLRRINRGTGKEVHHILEERFAKQLKKDFKDTNGMLSIALSKTDHRTYTKQWRSLRYGKRHELQDILKTGARIYYNNPKLMAAFLLTLENLK